MEFFLGPDVAVFSGVLVALLGFCIFELVASLAVGAGLSPLVDSLVDTSALPDSPVLNWLFVREMPLSSAITLLLLGFGATGLAAQGVAHFALGTGMPLWVALLAATVGAVFLLRAIARSFMTWKVVHTTALQPQEFIGQVVVLLSPTATKALFGEAKFTDRHGQTHYVMICPEGDESFNQGESVQLLEPTAGGYIASRIRA